MSDLKRTGKYISLLLRHHPEKAGIVLDEHGWTDVAMLLEQVNMTHGTTLEELHQIADGPDKKRYEFSPDGKMIRAVHGHSVEVDLGYEPVNPTDVLFHGTAKKFIENTQKEGLISKNRQYVHLSTNPDRAAEVGRRHGELYIYKVDSGQMYNDGYVFYHSVSDIYLTKSVPVKYLSGIQI